MAATRSCRADVQRALSKTRRRARRWLTALAALSKLGRLKGACKKCAAPGLGGPRIVPRGPPWAFHARPGVVYVPSGLDVLNGKLSQRDAQDMRVHTKFPTSHASQPFDTSRQ